MRSLGNILDCVSFIETLQIQGGEPFLYSDLAGLLDFCANQKKIKHIVIATNGTVMPSDDLLAVIKKHRVCIRISNYPVSKEKGLALQSCCKSLGIPNFIYNFAYRDAEWRDLGGIDTPREDDAALVKRRFEECAFRGCLTLENGELNRCSRIYVAQTLQNFQKRADDHVDATERHGLKRRLRRYVKNPTFAEACRYCHGTKDAKMIVPAEQPDTERHGEGATEP